MQRIHEKLAPGATIAGRYLVVDLIGTGGFSAVYLVQDQEGEKRFFALKEVNATDKEARKQFEFECTVLKRLSHPALPKVHEVFGNEEQNRLYMLMDYVEGPDLETLREVQPEKRFSLAKITALLAPIVDAMIYLHQQNPPLVHRDIKPSNIIVPIAGGKAILVDFGIAKEYDELDTTNAMRHGSPGYSAPEQYSTGTNMRTDIYELGATVYTLLTGTVPTDALQRMTCLANELPDPLKSPRELVPTIPAPISAAILRAMAIRMTERFATVQEFWKELPQESTGEQLPHISSTLSTIAGQPSMSGSNRETTALLPKGPASGKRQRKPLFVPLLLSLLLLLGIGAGVWKFTSDLHTNATSGLSSSGTPQRPALSPTLASTASPVPNTYARLVTAYQGSIYDLQANVSYPMTLTHMLQNGTQLSGSFSGLRRQGTYTGFLDASKHIYFTVTAGKDPGPLSFTGSVQANGALEGTFCQVDQNGQCSSNGIFGWWNVAPGPSIHR